MSELLSKSEAARLAVLIIMIVSIIIPIYVPMALPLQISAPVKDFYNTIQSYPEGSNMVLGIHIHPGNYAELAPVSTSILTHLFKRNINVLIIGYSSDSPMLIQDSIEFTGMEKTLTYGEDYVIIGFIPQTETGLKAFVEDFRYFRQDFFGNDVETLPLMKDLQSVDDVDLWVNCLGTWFVGEVMRQIQPHVPVVFGILAGASSDVFPYYSAGTAKGVLIGVKGAAEYEVLTGLPRKASQFSSALSLGHVAVVALIVVGNISFFYSRSKNKEVK